MAAACVFFAQYKTCSLPIITAAAAANRAYPPIHFTPGMRAGDEWGWRLMTV